MRKKNNLMSYAGAWKDIPHKKIGEMKEEIEVMRTNATDILIKKNL